MAQPLVPADVSTGSPAEDQVRRGLSILSGSLRSSSTLTQVQSGAFSMPGAAVPKMPKGDPITQPKPIASPGSDNGGVISPEGAPDQNQNWWSGVGDFFDGLKSKAALTPAEAQLIKEQETAAAKRNQPIEDSLREKLVQTLVVPALHGVLTILGNDNLDLNNPAVGTDQEQAYFDKIQQDRIGRAATEYRQERDKDPRYIALQKEIAGTQSLHKYPMYWDAFSRAIIGISSTFTSAVRGVADADALMKAYKYGTPVERNAVQKAMDAIDEAIVSSLPIDATRGQEIPAQIAQAIGSLIGFYVAGLIGKVLGGSAAAGAAVAGALGGLTQADQSYNDASNFTQDKLQLAIAWILGAGIGATEGIPVGDVLVKAEIAGQGFSAFVRAARAASLAGATEEAIQEYFQNWLTDVAAKINYDPGREFKWDQYATSAAIAAFTGGVAGAGAAAIHFGTGMKAETSTEFDANNLSETDKENLLRTMLEDQQKQADAIQRAAEGKGPQVANAVDPATLPPQPTIPVVEPTTPVTPDAEPVNLQMTQPTFMGWKGVAELDSIAEVPTPLQAAPEADQQKIAETYKGPPEPTADDYIARQSAPRVRAAGGMISVNENGMVPLTHWSPKPDLTAIDPNFQGTGPLVGQERGRLVTGDPDNVPRTYWGVDAVEGMKPKEARKLKLEHVYNGGYRKEGGLGNNKYTAEVDPNTLYNWYEDVDGLRAQIDRELSNPEQMTQYERIIRDAGWSGIYFEHGQTGRVVVMFQSVTPNEAVMNDPIDAMAVPAETVDKLETKVPGIKGVWRFLTDQEQVKVQKTASARALLRHFENMPPAEELAVAAISGQAKKGWYHDSANALIDVFGLEDAPRFAGLLAALSPQVSVETNLGNALRVWTAWIKAGRPTEPKRIKSIIGLNVQGDKGEGSILEAWLYNAIRSLTTADPTTLVLSGPKVNSFMLNLRHVTNEVTNDAWMANFALIDQHVFKGAETQPDEVGMVYGKGPGYVAMSAMVRKAAEIATEVTGDPWTPAEIQETVWSWAKAATEHATETGKSIRDMLAANEITDEMIASVPDFAVLFREAAYRAILELGGYNVEQAGSQRSDGRDVRGSAANAQARAEAVQRIGASHLENAASRLDRLVAQRREARAEAAAARAAGKEIAEPNFGNATDEDLDAMDFMATQRDVKPSEFTGKITPELLARPGYVVLTAKQDGDPYSLSNIEANARLEQELQQLGANPIRVQGTYKGEPDGDSFIAFMDSEAALALARKYNQESILTNRGLEFSNGDFVPADHSATVIGPEAEKADFYTQMPDGQFWSMGLDSGELAAEAELAHIREGQKPLAQSLLENTFVPVADMERLPGLPERSLGPIPDVVRAAQAYARAKGLPVRRQASYVEVDVDRAKRIAAAYEAMEHNPSDPRVKAAYEAMIKETLDQFQFVKATGLRIDFIEPGMADPYAGNLQKVHEDLAGGHLWVFPTDQGFGTENAAAADNPLLAPTEEVINGRTLLANDVFRIVHDFFGHGIEGSGFGARGEENAWQAHMRLYTEAALPALTSETRGQNSWVNYGPHGEANRADPANTVFADQKTGIMPDWTWKEGVADDVDLSLGHEEDVDLMALTNSQRKSYVGEQPRPGYIPETGPHQIPADHMDLTLSKIAQTFAKALHLTVRKGGLMKVQGQKIMGQYNHKTGVVRLRSDHDLSTLIHEGTHALHDMRSDILNAFIQQHAIELRKIAKLVYPVDMSGAPLPLQEREGFAELGRLYVMNRAYAELHFPAVTTAFDALLQQHDPALHAQFKLIGDMVRSWILLPSTAKLRNAIKTTQRTFGIEAALQQIRDEGAPVVLNEWVNRALASAVDRVAPLNKLVDDMLNDYEKRTGKAYDLKRAYDPRTLARMIRNTYVRAQLQARDGQMGYHSTAIGSPGLREAILRAHGEAINGHLFSFNKEIMKDLDTYLVALRLLDEHRRYREHKLSRTPYDMKETEIRKIAQELEARYGKNFTDAANMINQYAMAEWDKLRDAGLISDKQHKEGLDRNFYVPLQRDVTSKFASGYSASSVSKGRSIVKQFGGSDLDFLSPTEIMMQKTFAVEMAIAQNDIILHLAKLGDALGKVGFGVERVPAKTVEKIEVNVRDAIKQLTGLDSVSEADAIELGLMLEQAANDGEKLNIFRATNAFFGGINALTFWENGKLSAIRLSDNELGTDIVNLLNGIGKENLDVAFGMFAAGATLVRNSVTKWPDFILVNFVRDQFAAAMLNRGFVPFLTGMNGVRHEIKQDDISRAYNAHMGAMGGMNVSTTARAHIDHDINALRAKGYVATVFSEHTFEGMVEGVSRITEVTETGTRLGLFEVAYKRAKSDGLTDWEAGMEAAYIATDLMDYGLSGSRMTHLRRIIPFFNARIQGLYKMYRTLGADEVSRRKGMRYALAAYFKDIEGLELSRVEKEQLRTGRALWVKMVGVALASAALTAMLKGDPDYDRASQFLRDTGWVIPTDILGGPQGRIFFIPKPFELALLANLFERSMEAFEGDTKAMSRFMSSVMSTYAPPGLPEPIQAIYEIRSNWDSFTGNPIEPYYMGARSPERRFDEYTSEIAKWLGQQTGWSPMMIDHFMQSLGTSMARDLSTITNQVNPNRPAPTWADWPVIRRFLRKSASGATASRDFYDQVSTVGGKMRQAAADYKSDVESGNPMQAEQTLNDMDEETRAFAIMVATQDDAKTKRLNPMYNAADRAQVLSKIKKEIGSNLGLVSTAPGGGLSDTGTIPLSARQKTEVIEMLTEINLRSMTNAMIATGQRGWTDKRVFDLETSMEMLNKLSPDVYDEVVRRLDKKGVYDDAAVLSLWPEVKQTVLEDGADANLKLYAAEAKSGL